MTPHPLSYRYFLLDGSENVVQSLKQLSNPIQK
jgi:hypothetical protein